MSVPKDNVPKTWVSALLSVPLAVLFLAAGGAKLAGVEMLAQQFETWGYPAWFLVVVGAAEVVGAISLAVPFTRLVGALVLSVIMVGALATHVVSNEWVHAFVPLVILTLLVELMSRGLARRQSEELPSGEDIQVTP